MRYERWVLWIQMVAIYFFLPWEGVAYGGPRKYFTATKNISGQKDQGIPISVSNSNDVANISNQDQGITIPGDDYSDPHNYSTAGTNNSPDHENRGITIPGVDYGAPRNYSTAGTNNISGHENQGITIPGVSYSTEMAHVSNGNQHQGVDYSDQHNYPTAGINYSPDHDNQGLTIPGVSYSTEMTNGNNGNQHQDLTDIKTSCSTPQPKGTEETMDENGQTSNATPAPSSTENGVDYSDQHNYAIAEINNSPDHENQAPRRMDNRIIIGIVTGNIIILLLIGLGVFCFVKKHMKNKHGTESNANGSHNAGGTESVYQDLNRPTDSIYHSIQSAPQ